MLLCALVCCYAVMRCPYIENMRPVSVLFVGIGHFPHLSSLCPIPTKLRATTKKSPFPSHFMIIPNTERHPNHTKTDQFTISEVSTGLPRPDHNTTVRALHFYREKISALSSLVDSRRIVLTHATNINRRFQQLILFLFCK